MEITDLLKNRQFTQEGMKQKSIAYNKDYTKAVKAFTDRINADRKKEKKPPITFMAVRMKLLALKEIDDLRAFYKTCLDYRRKKKGNTFSKAFFGSLKLDR